MLLTIVGATASYWIKQMQRRSLGVLMTILLGATALTASPAIAVPGDVAKAVANTRWAAVTPAMLPDAIRAIEASTGGKVLEIRFRTTAGVAGFTAVVANPDDTIGRVAIATPDMKVVAITAADIPDWMAPWSLRADKKSILKAKIPLADSVVQAEQREGGIAIDARLAQPLNAGNAVLAYDIMVVRERAPKRVVMDAQTGEKIRDPQPVLQGWSPEEALTQSLKKTP
jgi:hypothetical protein